MDLTKGTYTLEIPHMPPWWLTCTFVDVINGSIFLKNFKKRYVDACWYGLLSWRSGQHVYLHIYWSWLQQLWPTSHEHSSYWGFLADISMLLVVNVHIWSIYLVFHLGMIDTCYMEFLLLISHLTSWDHLVLEAICVVIVGYLVHVLSIQSWIDLSTWRRSFCTHS